MAKVINNHSIITQISIKILQISQVCNGDTFVNKRTGVMQECGVCQLVQFYVSSYA